ncbi:hypothetical protein BXZ70DRAFT_374897 [Cristinia sonorae]|uniref:Uncharacterized protein n=1 Tax=Cristinia sonorae TaxID=1940300 RepID=A0A8K0UKS1_9AGAR|nr:hypothetical protein BXZ70DRAFT_374897 [Cristinia sonorae]
MTDIITNLRPLQDGQYKIRSCHLINGNVVYLRARAPNANAGVDVTSNPQAATVWFLSYFPNLASYRIWQHGSNNVLDAPRETENVTVWACPDAPVNWQQWAIRTHVNTNVAAGHPDRVQGYSLTPLSATYCVLTAPTTPVAEHVNQFVKSLPATPGGGDLQMNQLWVIERA